MPDIDLLTVSEAAAIARCSVREVNRVIDEHILPERFYRLEGGRRIAADGCALVNIYYGTSAELAPEFRSKLLEEIGNRLRPERAFRNWIVHHGHVTIDCSEFIDGATDRIAALVEAQKMIVEDPEILGGTPVIRGTRVPVHDVAASIAAGIPSERILQAYPVLDNRTLELAEIYAKAHPQRGRPRRSGVLSRGTLISEHKVPRRPRA